MVFQCFSESDSRLRVLPKTPWPSLDFPDEWTTRWLRATCGLDDVSGQKGIHSCLDLTWFDYLWRSTKLFCVPEWKHMWTPLNIFKRRDCLYELTLKRCWRSALSVMSTRWKLESKAGLVLFFAHSVWEAECTEQIIERDLGWGYSAFLSESMLQRMRWEWQPKKKWWKNLSVGILGTCGWLHWRTLHQACCRRTELPLCFWCRSHIDWSAGCAGPPMLLGLDISRICHPFLLEKHRCEQCTEFWLLFRSSTAPKSSCNSFKLRGPQNQAMLGVKEMFCGRFMMCELFTAWSKPQRAGISWKLRTPAHRILLEHLQDSAYSGGNLTLSQADFSVFFGEQWA